MHLQIQCAMYKQYRNAGGSCGMGIYVYTTKTVSVYACISSTEMLDLLVVFVG